MNVPAGFSCTAWASACSGGTAGAGSGSAVPGSTVASGAAVTISPAGTSRLVATPVAAAGPLSDTTTVSVNDDPSATLAGPVAVTFTPPQTELAVGATVPVSIQVNNVNDLAAVKMALKFDPKVLHINNLISGDLIKRNGPDLVPSRNILNESGDAAVGIARDPSSGGASESGSQNSPRLAQDARPFDKLRAGYGAPDSVADEGFALQAPAPPPVSQRFQFEGGIAVEANAAVSLARGPEAIPDHGCAPALDVGEEEPTLSALGTLKPVGQIRNSFILAVNEDGLWIVDQHVAHERVLFERILKQRAAQKVESQRLLMPLILQLTQPQQIEYARIADELNETGFETEPFGQRTIAVKAAL